MIPRLSRPWRALAAAGLVAAGLTGCASADGSTATPSTSPPTSTTTTTATTTVPETTTVAETTTTAAPETTTTVPETTTTVAETTTTLPPETTSAARPIDGAPLQAIGTKSGAEARRAQQRLLDLGFWLQAVDGDFGATTKQAVLAFQKYYGLDRTGKLDATTAAVLSSPLERVQARATSGSLVEVDKDRQVLMIVRDGVTIWALNTSTGSGQYYLEENQKKPGTYESGRSLTPSGTYSVNRERPAGWWDGDLGRIYRPKYFNGGIAIHGSGSIPAYPASHGCVRVSTAAMDMIWNDDLVPKGTTVVVYGADVDPKGPKPTLPPATTAAPAPPPPAEQPAAPDPTVPETPAPPPETTIVVETTAASPETVPAAGAETTPTP